MSIPRLPWPDDSLRLVRDGYRYGERGFARTGTDAFRTRLMGRRVTVMRGLDAARFFYEGGRFDRSRGAVPRSAAHLLQDAGSVQTLEDAPHIRRKELFLSALADPQDVVERFRDTWRRRAAGSGEVPMLTFASEVLAHSVATWAGIEPDAVSAEELTSMIDNAGRIGPVNWAGRLRRQHSTERTARGLIEESRRREPDDTPLSRLAHHVEQGEPLPTDVAAVELLNLLRPTVAVARFIVFAAYALHRRPEFRAGLAADPDRRHAFAQEVRRFFPFFPLIGGHATRDLEWAGQTLPRGSWVMLDLYGTDHHPQLWPEPRRFDPVRFIPDTAPPVVAQGLGDMAATHHCPGEPATSDLIEAGVHLLVAGPEYRVADDQDLRISLRRMPAAPRDGLRVQFA